MNDNEEICEPLKIRRLDINDRISNFNCGDEDLNDFILMSHSCIVERC